jgi:hypothetical protein
MIMVFDTCRKELSSKKKKEKREKKTKVNNKSKLEFA